MTALTQVQQVLTTASTLEQPFSEARLVEAVWKTDPMKYGMGELWEKYPNNSMIRSLVVGERGLVRRGYFDKVAPLTYEITDQAREFINTGKRRNSRLVLSKADSTIIRHQLRSLAFSRWSSNMRETINTIHACDFWQIPSATPGNYEKYMAASDAAYKAATALLVNGFTILYGDAGNVSQEVLTKLQECSNFLKVNTVRILQRRANK